MSKAPTPMGVLPTVQVAAWESESAPKQESMNGQSSIAIFVEETVVVAFPGQHEQEHFVRDHVGLGKLLQMMCCPICCNYVPLTGKTNSIEYYRECGIRRCPYAVKLNDVKVGKVHDVKCTENGLIFCLCPLLTCDGYIKLMGMHGADGRERFTFLKSLFPLWPCIHACAQGCAPLGFCCNGLCGCIHYCQGTEVQRITQPVYAGPWSRSSGAEPQKIGEFVLTRRFNPVCCCFAQPSPLKYYFKPTSVEGQKLLDSDLTILSLALQLYQGMPNPWRCCSPVDFQMPTGVCCLDIGLNTDVKWSTIKEVVKES